MDRNPTSVLVAHDDPALLKLYRLWLEGVGYDVRTATDGVRALASIAEEGLPDAAVLGLELARLDGLEVSRFLRLHSETLPIVFVNAREAARADAFAVGATDVLAHHCGPEQLVFALRHASLAVAHRRPARTRVAVGV